MEKGISKRILRLKEKMLSEPRFASIEQAKIITESYREHEDEPRILQRAYSLRAALISAPRRIWANSSDLKSTRTEKGHGASRHCALTEMLCLRRRGRLTTFRRP